MTLDELRKLFPHTERTVYLNHAATSPLSIPVVQAINAYLAQRQATNIDNYESFQPVVDETRSRLARLIGTGPDRVEFAPNTSYALNVVAQGLDWRPGNRIAIPGCEFPANVYPFLNLRRRGVEVDFIPHREATLSLEDIERTLTPQTRLLSMSWVQFLSGFRADLAAVGRLCRERGIIFCVDAIQGLGALRLDVQSSGVDFLACGAQKWLMGTQGMGFLYVSEQLQEHITPAAGWLHGPVDWDNFFEYELAFHPDAARFRLGTLNNMGIAALHAALGVYFEAGPEWCEGQVRARAAELARGLADLGLERYGTSDPAHASGIVTVKHPRAEAVQAFLQERGITACVRNRMLRFSPTYYNTPDEIRKALAALAEFEDTAVITDGGTGAEPRR